MTAPNANALDDIYDANAEYYDAITGDRVDQIADSLQMFASTVDPEGPPLIDIGAGTGTVTERLAQLIEPCPVIAIEPTRSLRAVLTSRIATNQHIAPRVTIMPTTLAGAVAHLPATIGGAIAFGMLPHLDAGARSQLLQILRDRLTPSASALVEVMEPWTNEAVPSTQFADTTQGEHRIEAFMQATPVGDEQLRWTLTYRRSDRAGNVVHEAAADNLCWVISPDTFTAEAKAAGLDVQWTAPDLALLQRSSLD